MYSVLTSWLTTERAFEQSKTNRIKVNIHFWKKKIKMFSVIFRGIRVIEPNLHRRGTQLGKSSIVHCSTNYTPSPLLRRKSKGKDKTVSQFHRKFLLAFRWAFGFYFAGEVFCRFAKCSDVRGQRGWWKHFFHATHEQWQGWTWWWGRRQRYESFEFLLKIIIIM